MFQDLIKYTLNGKPGWSFKKGNNLDVSRIGNINYHRRLFRIFDKDCPYTLTIDYHHIEDNYRNFSSVDTDGKVTFGSTHQSPNKVTARYKSEDDVLDEIASIDHEKFRLKNMKEKFIKLLEPDQ